MTEMTTARSITSMELSAELCSDAEITGEEFTTDT